MAKISHIMLRNPEIVPCNMKLYEVVLRIKGSGLNHALISKKGKLAGIISMEDIMRFILEKIDWNITVEKVMHSPEFTIEADKWLTDAIEMCEHHKVSHLAVVEKGTWVGIIRADDVLHTYRFDNRKEI